MGKRQRKHSDLSFGLEGDKHKLEVVDSGSGDVFYKSVHDTKGKAVARMCEIKGLTHLTRRKGISGNGQRVQKLRQG